MQSTHVNVAINYVHLPKQHQYTVNIIERSRKKDRERHHNRRSALWWVHCEVSVCLFACSVPSGSNVQLPFSLAKANKSWKHQRFTVKTSHICTSLEAQSRRVHCLPIISSTNSPVSVRWSMAAQCCSNWQTLKTSRSKHWAADCGRQVALDHRWYTMLREWRGHAAFFLAPVSLIEKGWLWHGSFRQEKMNGPRRMIMLT